VKVADKTYAVLGYRYGQQDQFIGPDAAQPTKLFSNSPYDSAYHRILVGVEGAPWPWVKLGVLGGPDIRRWANGTPAYADGREFTRHLVALGMKYAF